MDQPFTVYFDGDCPLCRSEIAFYRRRKGAGLIAWVDVSEPQAVPSDLDCEAALTRFHVRDRQGRLIKGGEAFAALWRELPAFRWIGRVFSVAPLRWMLNGLYRLFLPLRPKLQALVRRTP